MSEPKFTSGPWIVRENEPWVIAKDYGDMKSVFHVNHPAEPSETQMANAHLIAAAPELYEALDDLRAELFLHAEGNYFRPLLDKAEAALAKARGES